MITFSSLEPFALSSLLLAAVLGKLGKLGIIGRLQVIIIKLSELIDKHYYFVISYLGIMLLSVLEVISQTR